MANSTSDFFKPDIEDDDIDVDDRDFDDNVDVTGNKTDDADVPHFTSTEEAEAVLDKTDGDTLKRNGVNYPDYASGQGTTFEEKPTFNTDMVLDASSQPAGIAPKDMPYQVVVVNPTHDSNTVVRKAVRK